MPVETVTSLDTVPLEPLVSEPTTTVDLIAAGDDTSTTQPVTELAITPISNAGDDDGGTGLVVPILVAAAAAHGLVLLGVLYQRRRTAWVQ
ncbi:MAG: hypothetical protein AAGA17_19545 [Actinomycetota bacterium]